MAKREKDRTSALEYVIMAKMTKVAARGLSSSRMRFSLTAANLPRYHLMETLLSHDSAMLLTLLSQN